MSKFAPKAAPALTKAPGSTNLLNTLDLEVKVTPKKGVVPQAAVKHPAAPSVRSPAASSVKPSVEPPVKSVAKPATSGDVAPKSILKSTPAQKPASSSTKASPSYGKSPSRPASSSSSRSPQAPSTAPPGVKTGVMPKAEPVRKTKAASSVPVKPSSSTPALRAKPSEQPWTVRPGQEWKQKVVGRAQKTKTPGHAERSYREAISAAKRDDVEAVYLNRGYKKATGEPVAPNRRPDVTVVRKDGKVNAIEVQSKSDDPDILLQRNKEAIGQLPVEKRGKVRVIESTKTGD